MHGGGTMVCQAFLVVTDIDLAEKMPILGVLK